MANRPNIFVTIFEGENGLDFRSQGGTLDRHENTGQAALKAVGLFDQLKSLARYDGEAIKIADKDLLCYVSRGASKHEGWGTGRPEIDRPELRRMLYKSLPAGTVGWGFRLVRVDDDLAMHFTNRQVKRGFDLIVGADGAWS